MRRLSWLAVLGGGRGGGRARRGDGPGHSQRGRASLRAPRTRYIEGNYKMRQRLSDRRLHLPADGVAGVHLGLALPLLVSREGRGQGGGRGPVLPLLVQGVETPLHLIKVKMINMFRGHGPLTFSLRLYASYSPTSMLGMYLDISRNTFKQTDSANKMF